jgi:hypothetical protein
MSSKFLFWLHHLVSIPSSIVRRIVIVVVPKIVDEAAVEREQQQNHGDVFHKVPHGRVEMRTAADLW